MWEGAGVGDEYESQSGAVTLQQGLRKGQQARGLDGGSRTNQKFKTNKNQETAELARGRGHFLLGTKCKPQEWTITLLAINCSHRGHWDKL